jgi:hypothetical protein
MVVKPVLRSVFASQCYAVASGNTRSPAQLRTRSHFVRAKWFPVLRSVFASQYYAVASGNLRSRSSPHSLPFFAFCEAYSLRSVMLLLPATRAPAHHRTRYHFVHTKGVSCSLFADTVPCFWAAGSIPHAMFTAKKFVGYCTVFMVCRISRLT